MPFDFSSASSVLFFLLESQGFVSPIPGTKNYYRGCFSLGCVIVQWSCGDCISDEEGALDNGQCVAFLLLSTIMHVLKGLGFCS
jgi:hypothetical protein